MATTLLQYFQGHHPVVQALYATLFTWFVTAAGAVPVFFTRRASQKLLDCMLGMAAGVMIAASFWSLLAPAIEMETFSMQFKTLLGTTDKAKQRMQELADFAAASPFELPGIARASRTLQVMTNGALATTDGLRMVGDAAAAANAPIEELAVWFGRLYSSIKSGRPAGEALMRLQELGIMSGSVRNKIEELQKANASSAEVWAAVTAGMGKYAGMMKELSETTGGRLSTMRDDWKAVRRDVGDAAVPALNSIIEDLIGKLEQLHNSGAAKAWGEDLGRAINSAHSALATLISFIEENRDTLTTLAGSYVGYRVITAATGALSGFYKQFKVLSEPGQWALLANNIAQIGIVAGIGFDITLLYKYKMALDDINEAADKAGMKRPSTGFDLMRDVSKEIATGKPASEGEIAAPNKLNIDAASLVALVKRYEAFKAAADAETAAMGQAASDVMDQISEDDARELAAMVAAAGHMMVEMQKSAEKRVELIQKLAEMEADSAAKATADKIDTEINAERQAQARWQLEKDSLAKDAENHDRAAAEHYAAFQSALEKYRHPGTVQAGIRAARDEQRETERMIRRAADAQQRIDRGLPVSRRGRYAIEAVAEQRAALAEKDIAADRRFGAAAAGDKAENAGFGVAAGQEAAAAAAADEAQRVADREKLKLWRGLGVGPFIDAFSGAGPSPLPEGVGAAETAPGSGIDESILRALDAIERNTSKTADSVAEFSESE